MTEPFESCDVVIAGGGPAGAVAALILARAGVRVIVLEKVAHPRFHIGESFLPYNLVLLKQLGLEPALRRLPHVRKFGAELAMGDGRRSTKFVFPEWWSPSTETFNIERALFDHMLLNEAKNSGADVREQTPVKQILKLSDGDVHLRTDAGEIRAKYLIDASGQATIVGRYLGTRKTVTEKHLNNVAYFGHYENAFRLTGNEEGHPFIVMCDEGWFWMINIDEKRTSVGMVLRPEIAKQVQKEGVPVDRMLDWGIQRCPAMRGRLKNAIPPAKNNVTADFSYRCRPYAGEGYFLIGDAAAFIDPVFSTGICVGMVGADSAVKQILEIFAGHITPGKARQKYIRLLEGGMKTLFKIMEQFYQHSFREIFLNGHGPLQIPQAVFGVLSGNVFPKVSWACRWRMKLFNMAVFTNRFIAIGPRWKRFSLLNPPMETSEVQHTMASPVTSAVAKVS